MPGLLFATFWRCLGGTKSKATNHPLLANKTPKAWPFLWSQWSLDIAGSNFWHMKVKNGKFAINGTADRQKILELNYQIHQKLLLCQDQICVESRMDHQNSASAANYGPCITKYLKKSEFHQSLIKLWLSKVWVLSKFDESQTFKSPSFVKVWLSKVWVLSKFDENQTFKSPSFVKVWLLKVWVLSNFDF